MAMEDALVLADCLRRAASVERALEVYVRRRRPRADWVPDHYYQKVSTMGIVGRIRMIDARKSLARRALYCPGTGRSQARVEMRGAYSSRRD
jgi:2-polyprenyl-6-methoxyphenol hydroxylase-like FAD-dependent oxidoreductase